MCVLHQKTHPLIMPWSYTRQYNKHIQNATELSQVNYMVIIFMEASFHTYTMIGPQAMIGLQV